MRKAINSNPLVQIGLIAGLGLIVAYMLVTRLGGDEAAEPETSSPPASEAAAADGTAPTEAAPAPGAEAPATEAPSTDAAGTAAPAVPEGDAPAPTGDFAAGPGLPADVVDAYDHGQTVVLLITRSGGIDDGKLAAQVNRLPGDGVALFDARARSVAKYSRIAQGVDIDRAPALVVLEPKGVTKGGTPVATVSYGFRGYESVLQAVKDAGYDGGKREYYPE